MPLAEARLHCCTMPQLLAAGLELQLPVREAEGTSSGAAALHGMVVASILCPGWQSDASSPVFPCSFFFPSLPLHPFTPPASPLAQPPVCCSTNPTGLSSLDQQPPPGPPCQSDALTSSLPQSSSLDRRAILFRPRQSRQPLQDDRPRGSPGPCQALSLRRVLEGSQLQRLVLQGHCHVRPLLYPAWPARDTTQVLTASQHRR